MPIIEIFGFSGQKWTNYGRHDSGVGWCDSRPLSMTAALLRNPRLRHDCALPRWHQAMRTGSAVPGADKRLTRVMRIRISASWRLGALAATRLPKALGHRILAFHPALGVVSGPALAERPVTCPGRPSFMTWAPGSVVVVPGPGTRAGCRAIRWRKRPARFCGCALAAILDQLVTIAVPVLPLPEVALLRHECRRLGWRRVVSLRRRYRL